MEPNPLSFALGFGHYAAGHFALYHYGEDYLERLFMLLRDESRSIVGEPTEDHILLNAIWSDYIDHMSNEDVWESYARHKGECLTPYTYRSSTHQPPRKQCAGPRHPVTGEPPPTPAPYVPPKARLPQVLAEARETMRKARDPRAENPAIHYIDGIDHDSRYESLQQRYCGDPFYRLGSCLGRCLLELLPKSRDERFQKNFIPRCLNDFFDLAEKDIAGARGILVAEYRANCRKRRASVELFWALNLRMLTLIRECKRRGSGNQDRAASDAGVVAEILFEPPVIVRTYRTGTKQYTCRVSFLVSDKETDKRPIAPTPYCFLRVMCETGKVDTWADLNERLAKTAEALFRNMQKAGNTYAGEDIGGYAESQIKEINKATKPLKLDLRPAFVVDGDALSFRMEGIAWRKERKARTKKRGKAAVTDNAAAEGNTANVEVETGT